MNKDYSSLEETKKIFEEFTVLINKSKSLFKIKNDHYKNRFLKRGVVGIVVRIEDKLKDVESGGKERETLTECFFDIANYAIMGAIIAERNNRKDGRKKNKKI